MGGMVTFVFWLAASLLLAGAVFLVASVMGRMQDDDGESGLRAFGRAFRQGLRRDGDRRASGPVDTDMDAFFAANLEQAPGYVDAEELSDVLHRVQVRVQTPPRGTPRG
ncbi:hypothetical protein GCM10023216_27580 [Isoptericola chiayiensis]|uniref:DivIVA domain-containing protein n=2 Tax=Isoptericola chiayiensis TaxID=579446 RepID=A0ABP8YLE0_9MICO